MATSVEQFRVLAPQIISEAATYAAGTERDPETDGNIRELQTLTAALMAALSAIRL